MSRFDDHFERGIDVLERELGVATAFYVAEGEPPVALTWATIGRLEEVEVDLENGGRSGVIGRRVDVRTSAVPNPKLSRDSIRIARDEDATAFDDWAILRIIQKGPVETGLFVIQRDPRDVHVPGHYSPRL